MLERLRSRRVLWSLTALVAAYVGLHLVNHFRMDGGGMRAEADRVLEHARALTTTARPEYQELALAGLPDNPKNGPFVRLDAILDKAEMFQSPPEQSDAGLVEALRILVDVPGAVTVRFNEKDVVRHPLVAEIVSAYDRDGKMARGLGVGDD